MVHEEWSLLGFCSYSYERTKPGLKETRFNQTKVASNTDITTRVMLRIPHKSKISSVSYREARVKSDPKWIDGSLIRMTMKWNRYRALSALLQLFFSIADSFRGTKYPALMMARSHGSQLENTGLQFPPSFGSIGWDVRRNWIAWNIFNSVEIRLFEFTSGSISSSWEWDCHSGTTGTHIGSSCKEKHIQYRNFKIVSFYFKVMFLLNELSLCFIMINLIWKHKLNAKSLQIFFSQ